MSLEISPVAPPDTLPGIVTSTPLEIFPVIPSTISPDIASEIPQFFFYFLSGITSNILELTLKS